MYMNVKRVEVILEDGEHEIIAFALIHNATKDVNHWKQYGYKEFLDHHSKEIRMARDFSLHNQGWIESVLTKFEKDISEDT